MKICKRGHEREDSVLRCRTCIRERTVEWNKTNAEQLSAKKKAYRKANKERMYAAEQAWQKAHPDRKKAAQKKWRDENAGTIAASTRRRQASKISRTPLWCNHSACKEIYAAAKKAKLTVDHIIPLQGEFVSGLHWEHNLQLLPALENTAKGNKFDIDAYTHTLPGIITQ